MKEEMIKQKVIECMNNIGVYILEDETNFRIDDYIIDSIMFVSFIIELEQMFDVEIPDEYLVVQRLQTLDDVCEMIHTILKDTQQ